MTETSEWTDVAGEAEFAAGACRRVDVHGVAMAVFRIDGRYYAIEDVCSHEAGTLSNGRVNGLEITCPRHEARFSLVTGEALCAPAYEPVAVFPVRVREGRVEVRDDRFD